MAYTIDDLFSSYSDGDDFKKKVLTAFPNLRISGGDGSSYEDAVQISGCPVFGGKQVIENKLLGIMGYKISGLQMLNEYDGRKYDVLEVTDSTGNETKVYFDITN
jgi:hypothetical protein